MKIPRLSQKVTNLLEAYAVEVSVTCHDFDEILFCVLLEYAPKVYVVGLILNVGVISCSWELISGDISLHLNRLFHFKVMEFWISKCTYFTVDAYFSPPPGISEAKLGQLSLVWKMMRVKKILGHLKLWGGTRVCTTVMAYFQKLSNWQPQTFTHLNHCWFM